MAKPPGRKPGYRHPEEVRDKIKASSIINRLMSHIEAKKPIMDNSQVNAAKALLNKVLPDLQSVQLGSDHNGGPLTFNVVYEARKGIDYKNADN